MFQKGIPKVTLCCLLFIHIRASGYTGKSQDQTSSRTNTLFDDADDIQRQLNNEARDRIKFGRPKTVWVFHLPTHFPDHNALVETTEMQLRYPRYLKNKRNEDVDDEVLMTSRSPPSREWDYINQGKWPKMFPDCGGRSQSPVNLPVSGLINARGARSLLFQNYDVKPKTMTLMNDGKRMILFGEWKSDQRPLIYGGAAHSRRYLFHSLTVHIPAEHTVGGLQYPLETQAFYVSAEYRDLNHALDASPSDPQAFLAVANLYKYGNHTHQGLGDILHAAKIQGLRNGSFPEKSLGYFNPPFKEYACYQGSMTTPPCTESVLWLVRGRTLSIMRETWNAAQSLLATETEPRQLFFRSTQALNDRKVYLFK